MSLEYLRVTPYSTFFILFLAFTVSFITTLLNRKFIDRRLLAEWQREIDKWNAEKEFAKKTGDKKLMAKVKKQEIQILQIRAKISKQQTKTSLVTYVPLLIMWWVLMAFYGNVDVAFIPFLWQKQGIPFFFWYTICLFFFNFILSRILKVEMAMGTRM